MFEQKIEIDLKHLGEAVFITRVLTNTSREKLAELAKVSVPTLTALESGAKAYNMSTLFSVIKNLPIQMTFSGTGGDEIPFNPHKDKYGEVIKVLRSRMNDGAGWTLKKLHEESKMSEPALSAMENGSGGRASSFQKVLKAMDVRLKIKINN